MLAEKKNSTHMHACCVYIHYYRIIAKRHATHSKKKLCKNAIYVKKNEEKKIARIKLVSVSLQCYRFYILFKLTWICHGIVLKMIHKSSVFFLKRIWNEICIAWMYTKKKKKIVSTTCIHIFFSPVPYNDIKFMRYRVCYYWDVVWVVCIAVNIIYGVVHDILFNIPKIPIEEYSSFSKILLRKLTIEMEIEWLSGGSHYNSIFNYNRDTIIIIIKTSKDACRLLI